MTQSRQITFEFPALEECSQYLDDNRWGMFTLGSKVKDHKYSQTSYTLNQLPEVLRLVAQCRNSDIWISQASFKKYNRRSESLNSVGLNFVDVDYYTNKEYCHFTAEQMVTLVHRRCIAKGLPLPSMIVDSGKGLHLKWIHEVLPAKVLPKWDVVQAELVALFEDMGADKNAKDVSRILRVVGSVNQKNGKECRIVDIQGDWDSPNIYPFEPFADNLLPYTSAEVRGFRLKTKSRSGIKRVQEVKNIAAGRLSLSTLNWYRMLDLKKINELRGGDIGDGMRESLGFWLCNHYALKHYSAGMTDKNIWHEFTSLYREAQPNKPFSYVRDKASHLLGLMKRAAKGETITFNGRKQIPLYIPTNDYLINAFGITSTEQKSLLTIMDSNEKQVRNTDRHTESRRVKGMKPMADYNDERASKIADKVALAKKLYASDLSSSQIAEKLGVSKATANRYVNK